MNNKTEKLMDANYYKRGKTMLTPIPKMRTTALALATLSICLVTAAPLSAASNDYRNDAFSIENLKVNPRNGLINAGVKRFRNTGAAPVKIEFKYGEVKETVNARRMSINQTQNATSKIPFPCNETLNVRATLVSPEEYKGIYLEKELKRKCRAGSYSGTPNLVVLDLKRTQRGETNSRAPGLVKVRVTVANNAPFGMPNNNRGGNMWTIAVQHASDRGKKVRRALPGKSKNPRSRSNQYSYSTNISISCWSRPDDKYEKVKVTVDARNTILESNEKDNERTFEILRNRCRDAG